MKHYYILFDPKASINYLHLFELMDLAEYRRETQAFDIIRYVSIQKLAERLTFSKSTLERILKREEYKPFLSIDRANKVIILNNSFSGDRGKEKPFVMLTNIEVSFLREQQKNMLCKYYIYIKYYCGYSRDKQTNFTAKQFLEACGYSLKSQEYFDTLSDYNKLLVEYDLIEIKRYIEDGKRRNIYRIKYPLSPKETNEVCFFW